MLFQFFHRFDPVRYNVLFLFGHMRVRYIVSARLKTRVPTERLLGGRIYNRAASFTGERGHYALFVSVRDRAHGRGGFIVEPLEHTVQTGRTDRVDKPLDVRACVDRLFQREKNKKHRPTSK